MKTPSNPNPPASENDAHKARPIMSDNEPVFPCWLWYAPSSRWHYYDEPVASLVGASGYTHWQPVNVENVLEPFEPGPPTETPSSSRPANEGGEHQILGTGFYRDAEPGTFGQSEWLDLLMACQDGRATCMRVLEIIEREFALKSVAADEALLAKMTDAFLKWKLPKSVLCDGCCTMRDYPHDRYGTHLLNHPEAKAMFYEVVWPLLVAAPSAPLPPPTQGAPQWAHALSEIRELAEAIRRNLHHDIAENLRGDVWVITAAAHALVILDNVEDLARFAPQSTAQTQQQSPGNSDDSNGASFLKALPRPWRVGPYGGIYPAGTSGPCIIAADHSDHSPRTHKAAVEAFIVAAVNAYNPATK